MYIYQSIAEELHAQIKQGIYGPGEKLPSIRHLSQQYQVSVATIQQVYQLLESRRLVEAKPKSGYYVHLRSIDNPGISDQPASLELPRNVEIHNEATRVLMRCDEASFIDLGIAFPHQSFLPSKQIQQITQRLVRHNVSDLMEVHFPPGLPKLRHQICQRLVETGCRISENEIVITNGCQEALSLCLRAVADPGDTIAIETPTFLGILQLIEALGLKAVEIPSHPEEGISIEALAFALEQWPIKACALVPSFNNPLGSCMPEPNRQALIQLADKHDIAIIEDDLFGDLHHANIRPKPIKALDKESRVLYCSSVSKSISPGLRVGWVLPGRYQQQIQHLKSFTSVSTSTLAQSIIAEFISTGAYDRHLRQLRMSYAKQVQLFSYEILKQFPKGTKVTQPAGGYILWVELPESISTKTLHQLALENEIGIVPGHLFSASKKYSNYLRINCAMPWDAKVQEALSILARLAHQI